MSLIHGLFDKEQDRNLPKGQIFLYQGDLPTDTYLIREGFVKMYDITSEGNEKLLCLLGSGDIFPMLWPHCEIKKVKYFYEAFNETVVAKKPRQELVEAIEAKHELSLEALHIFTHQTEDLLNRLECIQLSHAAKKIALVLQYLYKAHGVTKKGLSVIPIPLTHQIIGDMAGARRETVSIELKDFEKNQICTYLPDRINLDIKKLTQFIEAE